jgi:hypothetical protein
MINDQNVESLAYYLERADFDVNQLGQGRTGAVA